MEETNCMIKLELYLWGLFLTKDQACSNICQDNFSISIVHSDKVTIIEYLASPNLQIRILNQPDLGYQNLISKRQGLISNQNQWRAKHPLS